MKLRHMIWKEEKQLINHYRIQKIQYPASSYFLGAILDDDCQFWPFAQKKKINFCRETAFVIGFFWLEFSEGFLSPKIWGKNLTVGWIIPTTKTRKSHCTVIYSCIVCSPTKEKHGQGSDFLPFCGNVFEVLTCEVLRRFFDIFFAPSEGETLARMAKKQCGVPKRKSSEQQQKKCTTKLEMNLEVQGGAKPLWYKHFLLFQLTKHILMNPRQNLGIELGRFTIITNKEWT